MLVVFGLDWIEFKVLNLNLMLFVFFSPFYRGIYFYFRFFNLFCIFLN